MNAASTLYQTDQTACYDSDGREIPCRGTGQDGDIRAGKPWPNPRFSADEKLVVDEIGGVMWMRNPESRGFGFPFTWQEARNEMENLNRNKTNGYGDWRLPTRRELFGIVSHDNINPALPASHPFKGIFPGYYWTAETCARLPDQAWYVHLGGGRVYRGMKQGSYMVWPVCGEHTETSPKTDRIRFKQAGSVIIDNFTGLAWMQDTDGINRSESWQNAIDSVRNKYHSKPGHSGHWRLPNIRELESLVDIQTHSPALPVNHPFVNIREAYWSSTTSVYDPRYAWVIYMKDGAVGVGFKPLAEFRAWFVRSEFK